MLVKEEVLAHVVDAEDTGERNKGDEGVDVDGDACTVSVISYSSPRVDSRFRKGTISSKPRRTSLSSCFLVVVPLRRATVVEKVRLAGRARGTTRAAGRAIAEARREDTKTLANMFALFTRRRWLLLAA